MHRGYEKLSEVRTYPQITALVNRIDWVSGYANEIPFIVAAEKLHGTRGPGAGPIHPADPHRDGPHLLPSRLHGLLSARAGRRHAALLRPARARAGARPARVGHRGPLPPQLQPDRRGQARLRVWLRHPQDDPGPARGFLAETRDAMDKVLATLSTRSKTWSPDNEIILARTKGIGIIPPEVAAVLRGFGAQPAGLGRGLRPSQGRELPALRQVRLRDPGRGERATAGTAGTSASPRSASRPASSSRPSTGSRPVRFRPRCPRSSRCPRVRPTSGPRTPRGRWGTTWSPNGGQGPYRLKIRSASLLQHLDPSLDPGGSPDSRHHRHHGQPRLRAGRRGQMIESRLRDLFCQLLA